MRRGKSSYESRRPDLNLLVLVEGRVARDSALQLLEDSLLTQSVLNSKRDLAYISESVCTVQGVAGDLRYAPHPEFLSERQNGFPLRCEGGIDRVGPYLDVSKRGPSMSRDRRTTCTQTRRRTIKGSRNPAPGRRTRLARGGCH